MHVASDGKVELQEHKEAKYDHIVVLAPTAKCEQLDVQLSTASPALTPHSIRSVEWNRHQGHDEISV